MSYIVIYEGNGLNVRWLSTYQNNKTFPNLHIPFSEETAHFRREI